MGFAFASIFTFLTMILSLIAHLALAAIIVLLFVKYLGTKNEEQKRAYLTGMITLGILLVLMLLARPILLLLGFTVWNI